jgi:hypothetical protein
MSGHDWLPAWLPERHAGGHHAADHLAAFGVFFLVGQVHVDDVRGQP